MRRILSCLLAFCLSAALLPLRGFAVETGTVEKIEVPDVAVLELTNGFWDGHWNGENEWIADTWYRYSAQPQEIIVHYQDGATVRYEDPDGVNWTTDQSYENQWTPGAYTATAEFMGATCSYRVNVLENPVERIEAAPVTLTAGVDGEYVQDPDYGGVWFRYDTESDRITVFYKDGTQTAYDSEKIFDKTGYGLYWDSHQNFENQWDIGSHTASAEYMGVGCTYEVHVVAQENSGVLKIVSQPVDYIGALNSYAAFQVLVNREDVTYQWYYSSDGENWAKSTASGNATNTLKVQIASHRLTQRYRCVITDTDGNQVTSDAVSMALPDSTIEIVSQPENFVGAVADAAVFAVEATGDGLTYRWYYSADGETWAESWSSGYNTPVLHPVLREYNSGRMFKCLLTDKNGNTAWTEAATMSLDTAEILVTEQPSDYLGRLNDLAEFTVEAEGVNLTYRWYFSTDGGETWAESWSTGYNSPTLTVRLYAYRDGYRYKCVIRSGVDTETESAPATLNKIPSTAKITVQPLNAGGSVGSTVTFTMAATGDGLTYQWQYSTDGGETWTNSGMTGAKTNTLNVTVNAARDGQMYRCVVTDDSGTGVPTQAAVLRVGNAPVIVSQPRSYIGAAGTTAVFTVEATGENLTYRWQYSSDGGGSWTDSSAAGAKSASISVGALAYRSGQMYRCIVTNEIGSIISEAATLTVQ